MYMIALLIMDAAMAETKLSFARLSELATAYRRMLSIVPMSRQLMHQKDD